MTIARDIGHDGAGCIGEHETPRAGGSRQIGRITGADPAAHLPERVAGEFAGAVCARD